jgi:hypothetical protein
LRGKTIITFELCDIAIHSMIGRCLRVPAYYGWCQTADAMSACSRFTPRQHPASRCTPEAPGPPPAGRGQKIGGPSPASVLGRHQPYHRPLSRQCRSYWTNRLASGKEVPCPSAPSR